MRLYTTLTIRIVKTFVVAAAEDVVHVGMVDFSLGDMSNTEDLLLGHIYLEGTDELSINQEDLTIRLEDLIISIDHHWQLYTLNREDTNYIYVTFNE